ncbi:MAG TPA: tRNA (guanosine(37)-N1)-methyltransferase TrmD [bacterium]|nr:tRNA (guanosine(37)-N1)-methyltransferase TrmD [bacterium]HOM26217.1 tRNA (guanosine(37)-N1)-methyltransferase TrmD [bacterium]
MRIDIITIFPEIFTPLDVSIVKRAKKGKIVEIKIWNLRDFSKDKHKKVDDKAYGGGKGMVLKCDIIYDAVEKIKEENREGKVILTSPTGILYNQQIAKKLSEEKGLVIICGHYEGVDERVSKICDYEISIGDYILTGGELPAMVIVDSVVRLLKGVLPEDAPRYDSFYNYIFDWPCYTRPENFRGMKVPEVLISGNHKEIERWRRKMAIERTKEKRPDLYEKYIKQGGKDDIEKS